MEEQVFESWEESLENFEKEYDEGTQEEETETETEIENDEQVDEESIEQGEEVEAEPDTDEQQDDDDDEDIPQFPEEKQNRAFKEMREKVKEYERQLAQERQLADLIRRIAERNGTTPEKIKEEFERRELERQAEEQNVPVEYLKKQIELENKLKQLESETFSKTIQQQAEELKEKYDLTDEEVYKVARYLDEHGFPTTVSLEDGYFLMNKDRIIEEQVKKEQQKRLQEKQEKRRSAALPHGQASVSQTSSSNSLTDEEYESIKKQLGLD